MLMEARLLDERREGEAVGIAKGRKSALLKVKLSVLLKRNSLLLKRMLAKGCYSLEVIAELTKFVSR